MNQVSLSDVCEINPRMDSSIADNTDCSFVPMEYVDDISGTIAQTDIRRVGDVKKGYTFFRNDDVIFAKITPCMENGKCAIGKNLKNGVAFGSTEFHVIRAKEEIIPEWIYHFLRQEKVRQQASHWFRGTAGQQRVPATFLEELKIPLPPVVAQKRIASLLARADRLRQVRRTAHELGNELLQSVFLEMFGDIARNEKGWNSERLENVCDEITVGYVGPMTSEYNQDGVLFLRSLNIKPFRIDLNDVKYISPVFHKKLKKSAIYPGNVVVVRTGLAGTAAVVPDNFPAANCSDLVIIRPSPKINNHYLAMLFNSTWGQGHVSGNAVGQIQQHFNIGSANEMLVSLPPLSLQEEFAGVVARIESLRGRMSEAERQVEGLFQALLHQSFGEKI